MVFSPNVEADRVEADLNVRLYAAASTGDRL
jgi:hypothetical protein